MPKAHFNPDRSGSEFFVHNMLKTVMSAVWISSILWFDVVLCLGAFQSESSSLFPEYERQRRLINGRISLNNLKSELNFLNIRSRRNLVICQRRLP